jgi:hypothetical protein
MCCCSSAPLLPMINSDRGCRFLCASDSVCNWFLLLRSTSPPNITPETLAQKPWRPLTAPLSHSCRLLHAASAAQGADSRGERRNSHQLNLFRAMSCMRPGNSLRLEATAPE